MQYMPLHSCGPCPLIMIAYYFCNGQLSACWWISHIGIRNIQLKCSFVSHAHFYWWCVKSQSSIHVIEMHFATLELHSAMSIAWIVVSLVTECNSWWTSILLIWITIQVSGSSGSAVVTWLQCWLHYPTKFQPRTLSSCTSFHASENWV